MANVIRQDVIQIDFDTDLGELNKLKQELSFLDNQMNSGFGDDAFDDFIKDTRKAVNGTEDVADELKKGSANANKFEDALEGAAKVNFNKLTSGINKATSALEKTALAVGKTLVKATAAGVAGLAGLTVKSLSMAGDLEQNLGGSEAVFGEYAKEMQNTAKTAYSSMGLSQSDYLATANKMGSLFQGAGFEQKEAMEMSSAAMQRAADVASIMGLDMDMAMESIAGAAKGNFTMMDNLGVAINDTTLKNYAHEKGLGELKTTQDKVNAAMQLFLEKTKNYDGNYAKENETFAGSLQTLKASFSNFMSGSGSIDDVLTSLKNFGKVVGKSLPSIIKNLIGGLKAAFKEFAPMIAPALKKGIASLIKIIYEGFTGKQMSGDMFSTLQNKISQAFSTIQKIVSGVVSFMQQVFSALAPVLMWIGDIALKVFGWIGDNINWLLPIVGAIIGAMYAYKAAMVAVKVVTTIVSTAQKIMNITSSLLAGKLPVVAAATKATGTASATSASQIGMAAKSFMQMGIGVLAVGAGVLLVAAGFWILVQASISLANAGWGAIAVMLGMVAAIALLAWGAASLGAALTAGAVGFIAFGAAVFLVGAGFALLGAGAWLSATALTLIVGVLPQLITYGFLGALAITALGLSLTIFTIGAALASIALLALAIPLTIIMAIMLLLAPATLLFGTGVLLAGIYGAQAAEGIEMVADAASGAFWSLWKSVPALAALGGALLVFGAGATVAAVGTLALSVALVAVSAGMLLLAMTLPIVTANAASQAVALIQLGTGLTVFGVGALLASVSALTLSVAFLALTAALLLLSAISVVLVATFTLMAVPMMIMSAIAPQMAMAFTTLGTAMMIIAPAALLMSAAILPLAGVLLAMMVPLLITTPLFSKLGKAFASLGPNSVSFANSLQMLKPLINSLKSSIPQFRDAIKPLAKDFANLASPAMLLAMALIPLASAFLMSAAAITVINAGLSMLATLMLQCATIVTLQMSAMVRAFKTGGMEMNRVIIETINQIKMTLLIADLSGSGAHLMNGLIRGMQSRKSALVATARSIAQAINSEFDKVQDIHSPSGVWESKGEYLLQGGIKGMWNMLPAFESTVQTVGEVAVPYSGRYTPENSTTSYSRSSSYETNTYAPNFNLTISGTNDDKATARKVKRWVNEAINDTFESMARKNAIREG